MTANTSGDYYIFYGNVGQGPSDPAAAAFTNTILIRVLPIDRNDLLIEDVSCAGFNGTQLSDYMRRFVPQYVNYNLYLISPTGNSVSTSNPDDPLFLNCRKFNPVINGYPTDEAVTVNKILHIDKQRNLGYMGSSAWCCGISKYPCYRFSIKSRRNVSRAQSNRAGKD